MDQTIIYKREWGNMKLSWRAFQAMHLYALRVVSPNNYDAVGLTTIETPVHLVALFSKN